MSLHPHLHALISHGGLNPQGDWVTPKKDILFPQKPVMMVYRGKLLSMIKKAMNTTAWQLPPTVGGNQLVSLLNKLGRKDWVVHFCERYDHGEGGAKYLSRYVKSGPLKNQQIISVTDQQVTWQYHCHQTKQKETLTQGHAAFIRQLIQHVPLPGKPTVRYSGLYNAAARRKLNTARETLGQAEVSERTLLRWQAFLESKGKTPTCETCGLPLTKMKDIGPQRQAA